MSKSNLAERSEAEAQDAPTTAVSLSDNQIYELYFEGEKAHEEDGLVWKTIFREGELAMTPGLSGVQHKPLRVVASGSSDPQAGVVALSDLVQSFEDRAFEHVTIPLSHKDRVDENTGFIEKLRVVEGAQAPDGKARLQAGMRFTDQDVGKKCKNGSIANCSAGIFFNVLRKADAKTFKAALAHVALTNRPFMPDLEPFGIEASDEIEMVPMHMADVAWASDKSMTAIMSKVSRALNADIAKPEGVGYLYVHDVSLNSALAQDESTNKNFVVPFTRTNGDVKIADPDSWTEATQEWIAASDELRGEAAKILSERQSAKDDDDSEDSGGSQSESERSGIEMSDPTPGDELRAAQRARSERAAALSKTNNPGGDRVPDIKDKLDGLELADEHKESLAQLFADQEQEAADLRSKVSDLTEEKRKDAIDARIKELETMGFEDAPGFLKEVRNIYLSDDGGSALLLSDEDKGEGTPQTTTQVVNRLIDALPKSDDGKVQLSKQVDTALGFADNAKPPTGDEADRKPVKDRTSEAEEELFGSEDSETGGEK